MSGWDYPERVAPTWTADNILREIERRKNDKAFMDRLEASIARNKNILDRLVSLPEDGKQ